MKVLDLFAGAKSVSSVFKNKGHEVFTVDILEELNPDLCIDILQLTPEMIIEKFGVPDVIWASPPCECFSIASCSHHWNVEKDEKGKVTKRIPKSEGAKISQELVKHTIELIKALKPRCYFIENPRGMLRKMPFMEELPRYTVTYCQYNDELIERIIWNLEEKKCPGCGETKPIDEFYKNKSRRDGFSGWCKQCTNSDIKQRYEDNKEKAMKYQREYREKNRESVRENERVYRENNRELYRAKDKRYRENNKEKIREKNKNYRIKNKEYFLNKMRERKATIEGVSDGTVTLEFEKEMYLKQNGKCAYCNNDLEKAGKHLDHIIPISRGGLHTKDNVHWVCPTCNLSKGNKLEEEWIAKERMKPTDLFTNHPNPNFKPMCKNGDPCHEAAPRGSRTGTQGRKTYLERSHIPEKLIEHIITIANE